MPDSIFELLTQKNRRDMVDFYNNHMEAKVRNRLNDYVKLDTLTDDYLHLTLSASSSAEMKLLETDDSVTIVALIRSITTPVADSRIEFYNTEWQQLHWLDFPTPSTAQYFSDVPSEAADSLTMAQRAIDELRFVAITADPSEPEFTLTLSVAELEREQKKLARRFLRPLRYRWTGSTFQSIQL